MPTCIKCHGGKTDITESTQKMIAQKYPNDKAIGYQMGDLRGMWKIKLK
jgi:cytochrome c551/c552